MEHIASLTFAQLAGWSLLAWSLTPLVLGVGCLAALAWRGR